MGSAADRVGARPGHAADVGRYVEEEEGEMLPMLRTSLSAEQLTDIDRRQGQGSHPPAPLAGEALRTWTRRRPEVSRLGEGWW